MTRPRMTALAAEVCALAALALAAPAGAEPPGPPGPPPGWGLEVPVAPGTAPEFVPRGSAAAIPDRPPGPGLLQRTDVAVSRARRTFRLPFACQANGTIRVTAAELGAGTLARRSYRCRANRATATLRLSNRVAQRLRRARSAAATAHVSQSGRTARLPFTLRAGGGAARQPGFWTDGHLQCTADDGTSQAFLVTPDFTTVNPTPITTRGWVAWYTEEGGWQWLGTRGVGRSAWQPWIATRTGIAQFHPGGSVTPISWTWGPISAPRGRGIVAVGVYEIVYWVAGRPDHQWRYVNAGPVGAAAAGGGQHYCRW